jgi:hypothetical protein
MVLGSAVESCCGGVAVAWLPGFGLIQTPRDDDGGNRRRRNELDEMFTSISPDAAAFVARSPALRAKLARAAERGEVID